MVRKRAWLAICGMMLSAGMALGQQAMPYGNPSVGGYPGYPTYGPAPMPYGYPYVPGPYAAPAIPNGYAAPPMPYANSAPSVGEPYFVPREAPLLPKSAKDTSPSDSKPIPGAELPAPESVASPIDRFVDFIAPSEPGEPYTTYEGRRYQAEVRQDNTRMWVQAAYIHWWVRRDNAPPLVTDGTSVLLGNGAIGPKEFSGIQANLGFWLDPEKLEAVEIGGFWLGKAGRQYAVAVPAGGRVDVGSAIAFHGVEANLGRNLIRLNNWTVDALIGGRYLYLNDTLTTHTGAAIADSFEATNRFYGGQIGARVNWVYCRFDVTAAAKIAFGANAQVVNIDGTAGSALAQPSNIGRHSDTVFAVAPQGDITAGWHVTPCLRAFAGYTFLYWTRIQRAADQVDGQIDVTQIPAAAGNPRYPANRTSFWAQGLNVGIELKF